MLLKGSKDKGSLKSKILESALHPETHMQEKRGARFGNTYTKIGTIQRRLAWPLRKRKGEYTLNANRFRSELRQ